MSRQSWKRRPFGRFGTGWVYQRGFYCVMAIERKRGRRWFATRVLTQLTDKRGNVRFFATALAAMRAADVYLAGGGKLTDKIIHPL